MNRHTVKRSACLILICNLSFTVLLSQEKQKAGEYQPEVGQEGKDVIWVPTPEALVNKMLTLAAIAPEDLLIDLGSGDGRTVISAAKRGTRAIGIEFNPDMVRLSENNAEKEGVSNLTEFIEADFFEYDLSKATVITMFLLPDINLKLRPKLLSMKPGTRIVTNTFTMMDWHWDDTAKTVDNTSSWTVAYLWIVPANAAGRWKLESGDELFLLQEFQMVSGEMTSGSQTLPVSRGRLRGNKISFSVGEDMYSGTVDGDTINGTIITGSRSVPWNARRTQSI